MPSHLDTLRRVHAIAAARGPLTPVDDDLAREAGMDGNYAHLLQSARDLDAAENKPTPTTGHTPGPWSQMYAKVFAPDPRDGTLSQVATTEYSAFTWEDEEANARRIVACVNALDGVDDPAAALAEVRETLARIRDGVGAANVEAAYALALLGAR